MQKSLIVKIHSGETRIANVINRGFGYSIILALLPILMMYKVDFLNLGLSTVIIAVSMVYAFFLVLINLDRIKLNTLFPIYLFLIWIILKSFGNIQAVLLCAAIAVHITALSSGSIDRSTLKKTIIVISLIASLAVIIQQILYSIFNYHFQMIASEYILEEMDVYIGTIKTGKGNFSSGYRPSAFFLEPAHFSQYCFVALILLLFDKNLKSVFKAIFVSIGVLLTTSGMGIAIVLLIWFYKYFSSLKSSKIYEKIDKTAKVFFLFIIVTFIAWQIQPIQYSILRVISTNSGEINAIQGRFFWWDTYIRRMSFYQIMFGIGTINLPDVYFTAIMELIYAYGIIGIILFYSVLINFYKKKNEIIRLIVLILAILTIVSNILSFILLIFYFGLLITLSKREVNLKCI